MNQELKCFYCGRNFTSKNKYYKTKTCSKECQKQQRIKTNKEKYGENYEKVTEKKHANNMKKYGVENPSKLDWVKDKKKATCFKNFGVEHPMQSKTVRAKSVETCLVKYGADNVSKNYSIIDKIQTIKNTVNEEGLTPNQIGSLKRRIQDFNKYGCWFVQTDDFREKYLEICLSRYGVENFTQIKGYREYLINKGVIKSDEEYTKFELYSKKVRNITEITFRKYSNYICSNIERSYECHLDHIYSIYDGFKNNIDEVIIGSLINLQLLPSHINLSKNKKSWMSTEQLLDLYNCYINE